MWIPFAKNKPGRNLDQRRRMGAQSQSQSQQQIPSPYPSSELKKEKKIMASPPPRDKPSSKENSSKMLKEKSTPNGLSTLAFSAPPLALFIQPPFFRQAAPSNNVKLPNFQLLKIAASHVVTQLYHSVFTSAHKFLSLLRILASHNPILTKLISFSSHLQSLSSPSQVSWSNYGNFDNARPNHNFAAILPGDSVAGIVVANGILNFLNIYNTLLIVRLVLTWFPNAPPAVVSPLSTLCDPYLNIFRGVIPPLGGTLDLSPILAFLVLNAFTSTAAALPAELPPTGVPEPLPSRSTVSHLTTSQKKWMKRLSRNKSKNSSGEN